MTDPANPVPPTTSSPESPASDTPQAGYPKAEYANFVRISHSPTELVLDFACLLPAPLDPSNPAGQPQAPSPTVPMPSREGSSGIGSGSHVCARVMMSPLGAKLLYRALGDNLARYEAAFGEIPMPGDPNLVSDLFRGTRPPDPPKPGGQKPDSE
ncbi:MAG TPA: DUF3467 domain-containing protein [Candidatus Methylomirabilis sp.]|nr:DUF3467 domain-containing protein [Candidatus Methylomirabilis sp.]